MGKKSTNLAASKKTITDTALLLTITIVTFVIMYLVAIFGLGGGFKTFQAFFDLLNDKSALLIVSCGLSIVMITGGIDISVGGVISLVGMCCVIFMRDFGGSPFTALFVALAVGAAFGIVQGFLVAYLEIQPFIVTLAGMFFARGMTQIISSDHLNVEGNEAFDKILHAKIVIPGLGYVNNNDIYINAYIKIGVIVALVLVFVLFFMLQRTKLGRAFYAVGGNQQSALMLGINVKRTKFLSHLICSLLAGIAGYVFFITVGSGSGDNAMGYEMDAIASSIIGGTMLTGGVGNIIGTMFGVFSLSTIQKIVNAAGLGDPWWTGITRAAMLCLFLVLQSIILIRKNKGVKA